MNRSVWVCLLLILLLAPTRLSDAQRSAAPPRLSVDDVMSAEDKVRTGVFKLTAAERAAFEQWLTHYTSVILTIARKSNQRPAEQKPAPFVPDYSGVSQTYPGVGSGHWIQDNGTGKIISLEDGSIWQINSVDQIDTALWLATTNITVLQADSPIGDYRYLLINTDDGEKALAKYLGRE
jgi:hypothetical protein